MTSPTVAEVLAERIVQALVDDAWVGHDEVVTRLDVERIADVATRAAAGLLAEGGETVTWYGVRDITSGHVPPDSLSTERKWCDTYLAEGADDLAAPEQVVARTVTTFPPRVTPWTEVTDD